MGLLIVLIALGALASLIILVGPGVQLIFSGEGKYTGGQGTYGVTLTTRIVGFLALFFLILSSLIFFPTAYFTQRDFERQQKQFLAANGALEPMVTSDAVQDQVKAVERRRLLDEQKRILADARYENELSELKKSLRDSADFNLTSGERVISGQTDEGLGSMPAQITEAHLFGLNQSKRLVVAFHLFPDVAYWRFGRASSFEKAGILTPSELLSEDSSIDFFDKLERMNARNDLQEYDLLISIGLQSSTKDTPKLLSLNRARFLCQGLVGLLDSEEAKANVVGLDIGTYTGPVVDRGSVKEKSQRPVLLVGLKIFDKAVDIDKVLNEIMEAVRIPGVDLSMYSQVSDKRQLRWVDTGHCASRYQFIRN